MERIESLGRMSEEPHRPTRRSAPDALTRTRTAVEVWMQEAGMTIHRDNVGNVTGRYAAGNARRSFLIGSRLDLVHDVGGFDGVLALLIGIAAVEHLKAHGKRLPFAVDLIGFAAGEGRRFHEAYLGSKALAGRFDPACLELVDEDGVTLADAIRATGGRPEAIRDDARDDAELLGYCELHIEQGPVLEAKGLPVGVVSEIVGKSLIRATFSAEDLTRPRPDALVAASELVLATKAIASDEPGAVATVGQLAITASDLHGLPTQAMLTIDARHANDRLRRRVCEKIKRRARGIASRYYMRLEWEDLHERLAVPCSPQLTALLSQAVEEYHGRVEVLSSGAGHDAGIIAKLTPIAMLLIRCRGDVTHNPSDHVDKEDIAAAIAILIRFLSLLEERSARSAKGRRREVGRSGSEHLSWRS